MNHVLYRLYTERRSNLADLTSSYFDGFTIIEGVGYWQGAAEQSTIIEILGNDGTEDRAGVYSLAEDIRVTNEQSNVLVSEQPLSVTAFTADEGK